MHVLPHALVVGMNAFVVHPDACGAWNVRPGCRILVMGRGAVRCDFPQDWLPGLDSKYVRIIDRMPPDDRCGLMISHRTISPQVAVFPIRELLQQVTTEDSPGRPVVYRGQVISFYRYPLEAAWRQMRFIDPVQGREACTHVCLARGGVTLATIVFDFWPEDEVRLHDPWKTILETLAVGDYIDDPASGRKREMRG
jgi:hypothetical protein